MKHQIALGVLLWLSLGSSATAKPWLTIPFEKVIPAEAWPLVLLFFLIVLALWVWNIREFLKFRREIARDKQLLAEREERSRKRKAQRGISPKRKRATKR